jgi:hypothetical protein
MGSGFGESETNPKQQNKINEQSPPPIPPAHRWFHSVAPRFFGVSCGARDFSNALLAYHQPLAHLAEPLLFWYQSRMALIACRRLRNVAKKP